MWFAIDTLEYLRRGGRIGGARAWIGSALKIKPILTLEEEITPVERVRTRARSIERLRDYARQRHEDGFDAWVVQHIQDFETADALVERLPARSSAASRSSSPRSARCSAPTSAPACSASAGVEVRPRVAAEPPAEPGERQRRRRRHQAADRKADDGGADDQLRAMLADLAAPVGELGDLGAERLDRVAEVLALGVDVARI